MSVEKSKHPIADMVFSLFCYFIALVIGLFAYFILAIGIMLLITGLIQGFSGGFTNVVFYGFVFFYLVGF